MNLRTYLKALPPDSRDAFAARCGTSLGYLRKRISMGGTLGAGLAVAVERESGGIVSAETLCPDLDWAYLRAPKRQVVAA